MAAYRKTVSLITGALALSVLAGCASSMPSHAIHAKPMSGDVYAADGDAPADIYRAWHLYKELDGNASVEGELRLADLSQWRWDVYRSAYYWYRRAAAGGDGVAAANLWYMYETASDSARDNQEAMGYYEMAVASDEGLRQLFALETKLAIDGERHYPQATAGQGTALIEFERADGDKATDVKVYRSSGNTDLDNAAIAAVQNASLPAVPAALTGLHHFIISVKIGPDIG
ncbi:MAG TPA: energy transducer TonB [Gammaproteobacteria bacterium]|nr:energy transducer TonB [Gammaproteobacteria bacterium]